MVDDMCQIFQILSHMWNWVWRNCLNQSSFDNMSSAHCPWCHHPEERVMGDNNKKIRHEWWEVWRGWAFKTACWHSFSAGFPSTPSTWQVDISEKMAITYIGHTLLTLLTFIWLLRTSTNFPASFCWLSADSLPTFYWISTDFLLNLY